MVRKYLFLASVAVGLTAVAAEKHDFKKVDVQSYSAQSLNVAGATRSARAEMNDGSRTPGRSKAASTSVEWRRPAGQFWGTGICPELNGVYFYFTPLQLRPWVDYTFENISTASGIGNWTVENWNTETKQYENTTSRESSVTTSYVLYEQAKTPRLGYRGQVTYPTQFDGDKEAVMSNGEVSYIRVNSGYTPTIDSPEYGELTMAVSSHYWGQFTRNETDGGALIRYVGAAVYPGMDEEEGHWFGTNASGINAAATRFEKPDMPYLLNGVYWYYAFPSSIPNEIPLKAYVVKTVNDAAIDTFKRVDEEGVEQEVEREVLEIGEILAVAEASVPVTDNPENKPSQGAVRFEFKQKNPVTGAENAYSLEIDDDITVIVTGFNAPLDNGSWISSLMSLDEFDEGYGNLGFLGNFDVAEDGTIEYSMRALHNFFLSDLPNTTLGVLADVSYPWIYPAYNYPAEVKLPNEGETTETEQGLQVSLLFASSSMTEDYEITYNGEDECDWFELVGVDDEMGVDEDGEEVFAGFTYLDFEAAPNPTDENRTVTVKISIPAASYEITFLQGSNNNAVEIVGVDGKAEYFDLQGRRVANPEKGLYIRKAGNKAEKVIL